MDALNKHFLLPGAIFFASESYEITTILGSCVSVCLWDKVNKTGSINHFLLPFWNGKGLASPRYGNIAIQKTIDKMLSSGSLLKNIEAKVFGGGEVLHTQNAYSIGQRNYELALTFLKNENVLIKAKSIGGELGRKIIFNTQTGEVKMRFIQRLSI
ncbi:MAG: hypothetical protein RIS47_738 [Bacteroidota bacterium]|jgi:chemotaxis protein CheD